MKLLSTFKITCASCGKQVNVFFLTLPCPECGGSLLPRSLLRLGNLNASTSTRNASTSSRIPPPYRDSDLDGIPDRYDPNPYGDNTQEDLDVPY